MVFGPSGMSVDLAECSWNRGLCHEACVIKHYSSRSAGDVILVGNT